MKALTFDFSFGRFAAAKALGKLSSRAYLSGLGPVSYREVPDPGLLGEDWVIVQTSYCGICGSDLKQVFLDAAMDNPLSSFVSFPHVMGHEVSGEVVEVGSAVKRVKRGDRVICYPWLTCAVRGRKLCDACERGQLTFCESFAGPELGKGMHYGTSCQVSGGFAPLLPAHESMCFPIPEGVSSEIAALADPFSVSLHAVKKSPPEPGETIIVFGCGGLGLTMINILRQLFRDLTIIGIDKHEFLRPVAEGLGADVFTTATGRELVELVGERTKSPVHRPLFGSHWLLGGAERVYDTVGDARTLETGLRLVRAAGTIVMVGTASPARFEWTPLFFKEVHLIGSSGYGLESFEGTRQHSFSLYLDLLQNGRIDPGAVVSHRFPLGSYKDAFLTARNKADHRSMKVLFAFGGA